MVRVRDFSWLPEKKNGSQTSYYLISLDLDDQKDRGSDSVLGKVRGNSVGSQYLITDSGLAPDKTVAPSMLRKVRVHCIASLFLRIAYCSFTASTGIGPCAFRV